MALFRFSLPPSSRKKAIAFFFLDLLHLSLSLSTPLFPHPNRNHSSASAGGPYSWLRKDPLVLAIGFLGWTVPAASPSPSFDGGSLFGGLLAETSKGLAQFPTPPSIDSPFWIYLITYHVGLFVCLTLAQIGVQGRKQGYF